MVLFVLRAAPVRADGAAAEVLIQQGLRLRREGKPEQALDKFRKAHEMAPSPRTYGQMGLVEASLKRWTDGETHLAVALANPDDPWVRTNRAFLDQALAICRKHVGDLVITGPAGAEVLVDGSPAGTLPAVPAQRVAEGTVEVTANAPGYEPFKQTVEIRPNHRTVVDLAMTRVPAPPPPPVVTANPPKSSDGPDPKKALPPAPPDVAPESHWRLWTGLSLGAVGAGGLAAGIVWLVVDGGCQTRSGNTGMCLSKYDTKMLGYIATGIGAAALIAGGIVLITGPSKDAPSVALSASPGALWLSGRF
jgi:hypothetical protein